MRLCSLSMPSSSGLSEIASIWVRQSRLSSKRKGVALPGSRGSGVVRRGQRAGCTYSSPRPTLAKFHEGFMDPPPQPLYSSLCPCVVCRAIVDRHVEPPFAERCWTTSAVKSVLGSLHRDRSIPNVNSKSRSFFATFSRFLLGSG